MAGHGIASGNEPAGTNLGEPGQAASRQEEPRQKDSAPGADRTCALCHQPAELDLEGIPLCRDCWNLQGSTCSGPLYRMLQEKRKSQSRNQDPGC